MKHYFLLLSLFMCMFISHAQTSKTIHVAEAGTLRTLLTETELSTVTSLTLSGNIDARDVKTMRDDIRRLRVLDLEAVSIQEYRGYDGTDSSLSRTYPANEMPTYSFYDRNWSKTTLKTIIFPSKLTSIGRFAFYECIGLTDNLILPELITSIGNFAFQNSGLTAIQSLNTTPPTIGISAFYKTKVSVCFVPSSAVDSYNAASDWNRFTIAAEKHVTINVTAAGSMAAAILNSGSGPLDSISHLTVIGNINATDIRQMKTNMKVLSFIDLSETSIALNALPDEAFQNKRSLNSIILPNSLLSIGDYAFDDCNLNGDLTLPNSLTTIGQNAFYLCSGLSGDLTLPNSLISIGSKAFYYCRGFSGDLILPNSITTIGENAFYYCNGFTGDLTLPNSLTTIEGYTFAHCHGFNGSLNIPNSITSIKSWAFYSCSGFTGDLVLPDSIKSIEVMAFDGCSGFTGNLILPNSITWLGSKAFGGCSGLTGNIIIPNSIASIETSVFYGCANITELSLGENISSIGDGALRGCSSLTKITVANTKPPTVFENTFTGIPIESCTLNVPSGTQSSYQLTDYWDMFIFYTETIYNLDHSKAICAGELPYMFGSQEIIESGVYTETFQTANGTDSIVRLALTVNLEYDLNKSETFCVGELPYIFGSQELIESGTYTETFQSIHGCDSTVTLTLTVKDVNTEVAKEGNTLTAQAIDASYQWLDCDNGLAPIIGETNQTFTPAKNGRYAVKLTENGCSDISVCYEVLSLGVLENSYEIEPFVYPNPTSGRVSVELWHNYPETIVTVHDLSGRLVQKAIFKDRSEFKISIDSSPGIYLINLQSGSQKSIVRVIKE